MIKFEFVSKKMKSAQLVTANDESMSNNDNNKCLFTSANTQSSMENNKDETVGLAPSVSQILPSISLSKNIFVSSQNDFFYNEESSLLEWLKNTKLYIVTPMGRLKISVTLLFYISLAVAFWITFCYNQSNFFPSKGTDYCSPYGEVETSCCDYETIEEINRALFPSIKKLLSSLYFRYYKINLHRPCPFWKESPFCLLNSCAVTTCNEDQIPFFIVKYEDLANVKYPPVEHNISYLKKLSNEFCVLENEDQDAVFVNLLENEEKFTGYVGENSLRVWKTIYDENYFCSHNNSTPFPPMASDDASNYAYSTDINANVNDNGKTFPHALNNNSHQCIEKRLYYRVVSGLHASISTHIAMSFLNTATGKWERNFELFHDRVGSHPERIKNMFFVYMVVLRALTKLSGYLENYPFLDENGDQDLKLMQLVNRITNISSSCPTKFERALLSQQNVLPMINELKNKFQLATRTMDCVACEKCRLWGKIQFTGIGTALKVIIAFPDTEPTHYPNRNPGDDDNNKESDNNVDFDLSREEVVALFNVLGRLGESLSALDDFRTMYEAEGENSPSKKLFRKKNLFNTFTTTTAATTNHNPSVSPKEMANCKKDRVNLCNNDRKQTNESIPINKIKDPKSSIGIRKFLKKIIQKVGRALGR